MKTHIKKELGEVMLESMMVMLITMLMLVWILGIGFIYYQKYAVRVTTNDVAKKVAATYNSPTSDIIMGYISVEDLKEKSLYGSSDLTEINRLRSDSYVNYIMNKANLYGTVESVQVNLELEQDGLGRTHIAVTTECSFNTPFGEGLEIFGMSGRRTYSVTAYADSTNISEYVSTITVTDALTNGTFTSGTGFIDKTIKMINSFIEMCNQLSN